MCVTGQYAPTTRQRRLAMASPGRALRSNNGQNVLMARRASRCARSDVPPFVDVDADQAASSASTDDLRPTLQALEWCRRVATSPCAGSTNFLRTSNPPLLVKG